MSGKTPGALHVQKKTDRNVATFGYIRYISILRTAQPTTCKERKPRNCIEYVKIARVEPNGPAHMKGHLMIGRSRTSKPPSICTYRGPQRYATKAPPAAPPAWP